MAFKVPEQYRITVEAGEKLTKISKAPDNIVKSWIMMNVQLGDEQTGMFILPNPRTGKGMFLLCKASGGEGWEHVSISIPSEDRCPTWEEMCFVKDLFWN